MKFIFALLLTITLHFAYAQKQLLEKYDFNQGGYTLLGMRSESDPNELADSLDEFYTNDIAVLNEIKQAWTFSQSSPMYACGYHYVIVICKNGSSLENFEINLNCNVIASDQGYFYFNAQLLRKFKDKLKKPRALKMEFRSLNEARTYRNNILNNPKLLWTANPSWTEYEGTFKFTYTCKKNCLSREEKLVKEIEQQISTTYPGEPFILWSMGGGETELEIEVICNKSLSDKFNLYPQDEYQKWDPYNIVLFTYWISLPE